MHIEGVILDADYLDIGARSTIRLTVKQGSNVYPIFDKEFRPYFYLAPGNDSVSEKSIGTFSTYDKNGTKVEVYKVEKDEKFISGKKTRVFRIYANAAREIPVLKSYMQELGVCYEYDILFWKRYLIDKNLSPLFGISAVCLRQNRKKGTRNAAVKPYMLRHRNVQP
jgi:DNA polymerase elongation subunit (family B)